jgi:hypothetical protein
MSQIHLAAVHVEKCPRYTLPNNDTTKDLVRSKWKTKTILLCPHVKYDPPKKSLFCNALVIERVKKTKHPQIIKKHT